MKILKLELKGYKLLSLSGIDHLTYTPESKIQLILGTNGSGKSSLLKELSPLPASSNEFYTDGYKQITIDHNNSIYTLRSDFKGKATYSFIVDEEELNPVGGITAYRELVQTHFKYNDKVHELLLGLTSFTSMTIAARREWLTQLSNVDYTYALGYFNRLSRASRDIDGAIRLLQARLVAATEKLIDDNELEQEKLYLQTLDNLIKQLHQDSGKVERESLEDLDTELRKVESGLHLRMGVDVSTALYTLQSREGNHSLEAIQTRLEELRTKRATLEGSISTTLDSLQKAKEHKSLLDQSGLSNKKELESRRHKLESSLGSSKKSLALSVNPPLTSRAIPVYKSIETDLRTLLGTLEADPKRKINQKELDNHINLIQSLTQNQLSVENKVNALILEKKELERCKQHEATFCPQCNHSWHIGYNEKRYKQIDLELEELHKVKNDTLTKLEQAKKTYERYHEQLTTLESLRFLMSSTPDLKPFWEYLVESGLVKDNPSRILLMELVKLEQDLESTTRIESLQSQLDELDKAATLLSQSQDTDIESVATTIKEIESSLEKLYSTRTKLQDQQEELQYFLDTYMDMSRTSEFLQSSLETRRSIIKRTHDQHYLQAVTNTLSSLQELYRRSEQSINERILNKSTVENLQAQITEYKAKQTVYRIALKELSPTEGLIAKGLSGFINNFIFQVNTFIERIWLYPLEIQPVVPNEEDNYELNYRFSLVVNDNKSNQVQDISRGSSAMREVIDLAFKVVASKYLGLDNFPLYLDELAASFDKAHRHQAQRFMLNLAEISDFSQVFIISHYEELYSAFQNADYNVLSDLNIPKVRNSVINKYFSIQ